MARFGINTVTPQWEIKIFGQDFTREMRKFVSSIRCKYSDKEPPKCTISVTSVWFLEDLFRGGTSVSVRMGWDRLNMANMFFGKVTKEPDGQADEKLSYRIDLQSNVIDLAKVEKTGIMYWKKRKSQIVAEVASRNGYGVVVQIADDQLISKDFAVKQGGTGKGETDLEFLYRIATNWHCIVFIDDEQKIIHFIDADEAHEFGNSIAIPSISDILQPTAIPKSFPLNYRTSSGNNNIGSLQWKKTKALKGDPTGAQPAVTGAVDIGGGLEVTKTEDGYTLETEFNGEEKVWKLKSDINKGTSLTKVLAFVGATAVARNEDWVRQYFVPITGTANSAIQSEILPRKDKRRGFRITVNLNKGDPFLRPPRVGFLNAGGETGREVERDADLPGFLFTPTRPTKYFINEVEHGLVGGMLTSKVQADKAA